MIADRVIPAVFVALLLMAVLEYAIHRWVMHGRRWGKQFREHAVEHHAKRRNGNYIGLPLRTSLKAVLPVAVLTAWWPTLSIALVVVAVAHCAAWTVLHHSYHGTGYMWACRIPGWNYLYRHHLDHHRHPHLNFGAVFGPIMDIAFGTRFRPLQGGRISETVTESLASLQEEFRLRGFYRKATGQIIGQLLAHVGLILAGIALFFLCDLFLLRLLGLFLAALGSLGVTTNCHTASHFATSERKWINEFLTYFGFPFMAHISATYWWHKHVVRHHPAPNIIGADGDIEFYPWFAYTQCDLDRSTAIRQLYYRCQWLVLPVAIGLLAFKVQADGWQHLVGALWKRQGRRSAHWLDLAALLLHWLVWYGLPLMMFPLADVLLFNLGRFVLAGYAMFIVLAPSHLPDEAIMLEESQKHSDFVGRQTATTLNYRPGFLGRFFCSGVEYQIEHHLFSCISHVYLGHMSPLVEAFCRRHGYPYRSLSWGQAVWKAYKAFWRPKQVVALLSHAHDPVQH